LKGSAVSSSQYGLLMLCGDVLNWLDDNTCFISVVFECSEVSHIVGIAIQQ